MVERSNNGPSKEGKFEDPVLSSIFSRFPTLREDALKAFNEIKSDHDIVLKGQRDKVSSIESEIYRMWKEPLDLLEVIIGLSSLNSANINKRIRPGSEDDQVVLRVISRLYARACLISREMHTLMKYGYSEGAFNRWRTLHELSIFMVLIVQKGKDVAKRFDEYIDIEFYKYFEKLREININDVHKEEAESYFQDFKKKREALIEKYDKNFAKRYGWISGSLDKKTVDFKDIQESAGFDRLGGSYLLASKGIHVTSLNLLYHLGLPPNDEDVINIGPSVFDISLPGRHIIISLRGINNNILSLQDDYESILNFMIMEYFSEEAERSFIRIENDILSKFPKK